ncbi:hypothetical protein MFRU_004g01450 [Monilinia fructicola]|uniref:Uncharacterized protein n=1 Tax=Monilinia fructicola TaxID=38448 RepID=A0A5M9JKS2_MONFR|nr:hypothetical protein EYC84_000980 [Monilinia fructicola]KAG4033641.1 hypothetical protein MFRU_004g01450 [Monilinia fructicola]
MDPASKDSHTEEVTARLRRYGLYHEESAPNLIISGNHYPGSAGALKGWGVLPSHSTEIVLRHSEVISFTVRLIPDFSRPASQKSTIKKFQRSLNHIGELPFAINQALNLDLDPHDAPEKSPWKDVLRIEIEGPSHLHLTLLDIPSPAQGISNIETGYEEDTGASIAETASFASGSNTPTHTSITESFFSPRPPPAPAREAVPHAGKTFVIRDREHGGVITLKEGHLQVSPHIPRAGGCHWNCIERDGWLGFRNGVSGQFFGHDSKGKFHCKVMHHRNNEWFCARAHPAGGHLLLMLHGDKFRQMKIGSDGTELVETDGQGTAWHFIEV